MVTITKETYENNGIEVITEKVGELSLNERHIQEQLRHKNLLSLTNKYDQKYKKCIFTKRTTLFNFKKGMFCE